MRDTKKRQAPGGEKARASCNVFSRATKLIYHISLLVERSQTPTHPDYPCLHTLKQEIIPSAISSGDTLDFQTWDISAWTNAIQIRPKFGRVDEWISIKEVKRVVAA